MIAAASVATTARDDRYAVVWRGDGPHVIEDGAPS
jgi:hypothetical protein